MNNFTGNKLLSDCGISSEVGSFYLNVFYYRCRILLPDLPITSEKICVVWLKYLQCWANPFLHSLRISTNSVLKIIEMYITLGALPQSNLNRIFSSFPANVFLPFPRVFLCCQFFSILPLLGGLLICEAMQGGCGMAFF